MQHTKPGEFFTWHSDDYYDPEYTDGYYRAISYLIYLNDVEEGGETEFIDGFKALPKNVVMYVSSLVLGPMFIVYHPLGWQTYHCGMVDDRCIYGIQSDIIDPEELRKYDEHEYAARSRTWALKPQ